MRTLDRLAESFLGGDALERPGLIFARGSSKGGSSRRRPDDGEDEDDPDDDEDEDDDDPDDDLADMDEDELRAELRKAQERLSKASGSSAAKRKRIKKLREELAEAKKPKPASSTKTPPAKGGKADDAEPVDVEAVKATVKAEVDAAANARIVKAEARGALKSVLGADATKAQVSRLVGMLDLKDIDVDDDGEVDEDALDEAIEQLKKDWPQLFPKAGARTKRERVAGAGDSGGRAGERRKKPTATELQVAAALGKKIR